MRVAGFSEKLNRTHAAECRQLPRTKSNSRINGTEFRPWSAESLAGLSKPSKLLVFSRVTLEV